MFPLLVTELHHLLKPMTTKQVHTKQLTHAIAAKILAINLKYTTLDKVEGRKKTSFICEDMTFHSLLKI